MTRRWQPLRRYDMPPHLDRRLRQTGETFHELWRSDIYEVFVRYIDADRDGALHLSIKRLDREPVTDWRHKQAIKNEVAGPFREALELFPDERRLVDSANQTHLWVLPLNMAVPVGYEEYAAFDLEEGRRAAVAQGYDRALLGNAKQREWQPGITTGPHYARANGWLAPEEEST